MGTERTVEHVRLRVNGAGVSARYVAGPEGAPLVLLVHGVAAHARWWDHLIAPLAAHASVAVPDLSGHGDSDHLETYSGDQWADELAALIAEVGHDDAIVVGHSMGGRIGAILAGRDPYVVRSLVLLDSNFRRPEDVHARRYRARATRRFPSWEEAREAFRLFPPETRADPALLDHVASASIGEHANGWGLKYDPGVFGSMSDAYIEECLRALRCPLTFAWSSRSPFVTADTVAYVTECVHEDTSVIVLDDCYHHVILDVPEVCTELIIGAITATRDPA